MNEHIKISTVSPDEMSGKRLDQALAILLPEHSRARLQGWIRDGYVLIDKKTLRPRDKIQGGEQDRIHRRRQALERRLCGCLLPALAGIQTRFQ